MRPLKVVGLIHTVQIFDMVLAILDQLYQDCKAGIAIVLDLNHFTQLSDIDYLLRVSAEIAEHIWVVEGSYLQEKIEAFAPNVRLLKKIGGSPDAEVLAGLFKEKTYLIKSHGYMSSLALQCVAHCRTSGAHVLAMLEGQYPPGSSIPVTYMNPAAGRYIDTFLVSSRSHIPPLKEIYDIHYAVTGYPKAYPAWTDRAKREAKNITTTKKIGRRPVISVFTRGEAKCDRQHLMPNNHLKKILTDVLNALPIHYPDCLIYVKPHPYQDLALTRRLVRGYGNAKIVFDHPSVLTVMSNLVIATFSTTIVEAVCLGIPAIEYFIPNEYFYSAYPQGSHFRQMGVMWCENESGLMRCLEKTSSKAFCPNYALPNTLGDHVSTLHDQFQSELT